MEHALEVLACDGSSVTVTARPELRPSAFTMWPPTPDPESSAQVEAERQQHDARTGHRVFEVAGCGKRRFLLCEHPTNRGRDRVRSRVICVEPPEVLQAPHLGSASAL